MNTKVITHRLTLVVLGFSVSIVHAQELPPPVDRPVSFARDVHPILAARCYECHGNGNRKGGLGLATREAVLEGGELGPVVELGDSAKSPLIHAVAGLDPEFVMPKEGPRLTLEEIAVLRAWIDQGLPWDLDTKVKSQRNAPISPHSPQIPENSGLYGSRNPIDRFIKTYFAENEVEIPPLIDDRAFARRTWLDVVGLTPGLGELETFLAGGDRDGLIDSLLARDRDYAEHWMTFWNDHLRNDFTGTGYIDGGRKQITAWLYDALYENKPFDQFVRELIAPTEPSRGFTDGIVWRGVVPAAERPPVQAARSVAQVFLGVNLKCASCHDSFIDDWKLADAYGLANVFSEGPLELVRCDTPTGRLAETRFLWPELGIIDASATRDVRMTQLAELVTKPENGRFARTIVNRVWAFLMGRGLVEPLDTMANEAWHPDLLDWLASDFVAHSYDLKHLLHRIMTSKTYQLRSTTAAPGDGPYVFTGPLPRRLTAEQMLDALSRVTGVWQEGPKFNPPDDHSPGPGVGIRAWRIPSDPFTRALGRPNREQVVTRRPAEFTTLQALEMTNGEVLAAFLARGAAQLVVEQWDSPEKLVESLYLRALQRPPNPAEYAIALETIHDPPTRDGIEDFLWMLAMLPEFQLIY